METERTEDLLATVSIPSNNLKSVTVKIFPRSVVFLVGQNGTGKSALMHHFKSGLGERAVYMPGSRPSYFDADSLSMTAASRRQLTGNLRSWDSSPDTRWKAISGTSRNEKAVHDLQNVELCYTIDAATDIKLLGKESLAIERLASKSSPLDKVNELLEQANLPVRLVIDEGELRATRGGAVYSFAKMSDGERTSLIFAAEVVSAPPGSVFVVDEPELHLHRSIIVPLLKSLIETRVDCGFIVSTHELALPGEISYASALLVRGCQWRGDVVATWDLDLISNLGDLPETLRVDVLGSRKKILFVEGIISGRSLDYPLYALLFPNVSVVDKESCKEVHRAVVGVRSMESHHHAKAFGMVDQDGMGADRAAELKDQGVHALPMFAVESIYYSGSVLSAVAEQQALTFGGTASILLKSAKQQALSSIQERDIVHLASRVAERQLNDQLQFVLPSRQEMIDSTSGQIAFTIPSPYPVELAKIKRFVADGDLDSIICRYPIRESGILSMLSKGLRFVDRVDFEKAALARIGSSPILRQALRDSLGDISALLQ